MMTKYTRGYAFGRSLSMHRAVVEKAMGKPLPEGSVVHHWDEDGLNNEPTNLLVCPDEAYHNLIHRRMKAYDECGHAGWAKCSYCGQYDDPAVMQSVQKNDRPSTTYWHGKCRSLRRRGIA